MVLPGRDGAKAQEKNQVLGNEMLGEDLSLPNPPELLLLGVREEARGCGGQR